MRIPGNWLGLWLLIALGCTALAASAQTSSRRESQLNGLTLGTNFAEVLRVRGLPHYIGPALSGPEAVEKILNPPPVPEITLPTMPTAGAGPGMADPGVPAGPPKPKPEEEYIVWFYEGNGAQPNPGAGFVTYVFFNKYGAVVGIAMAVRSPDINPGIRTARGVGFGTRMISMVEQYDWPETLARVEKYYYCSYPDRAVTFSLDVSTRRVVVIAIGMPMTVVQGEATTATGGAASGSGLPGGQVAPY